MNSGRHNTRLMTGAAVLNVVSTLAGASPAPMSTLVNAGTTITAAMNALRTKPIPGGERPVEQRALAHAG
jgi:hypothetical protein